MLTVVTFGRFFFAGAQHQVIRSTQRNRAAQQPQKKPRLYGSERRSTRRITDSPRSAGSAAGPGIARCPAVPPSSDLGQMLGLLGHLLAAATTAAAGLPTRKQPAHPWEPPTAETARASLPLARSGGLASESGG